MVQSPLTLAQRKALMNAEHMADGSYSVPARVPRETIAVLTRRKLTDKTGKLTAKGEQERSLLLAEFEAAAPRTDPERPYRLSGEPAASRIESTLDAFEALLRGMGVDTTTDMTGAKVRLDVTAVRAVLAELHDYQQGVKAVLAHTPTMARNVYSGGYRDALEDVRKLLGEHIPDVADDGRN